ncbi:hypothetical protein V5O48_001178 [Marasmius crinis-equi]|uniref:RRM domain-containing protein n=1 Tax=Marasmius crinis-equi TaxID=585013 RepID=A0ABR3FZG3_9AGAR
MTTASASASKLTKKQKKALAFRERKTGKGGKNAGNDMEGNEVPEMEVQDDVDAQADEAKAAEEEGEEEKGDRIQKEDVALRKKSKGKAKEQQKDGEEAGATAHKGKKRKRENEGEGKGGEGETKSEDSKSSKRRKTEGDKPRLILFLGNLKYTTSQDSISEHFNACDPPPKVRLLTPKTSSDKTTTKSKGCAFLEFENRDSLQQALKLHHSKLDGRTINVELTAGGGGNSESRLKKLRERNKKLHGERKPGKETKSSKGENAGGNSTSQRYSATSGVGEAPAARKTWTVGDVVEEGVKHRGGKKHSKRGARKPAKEWGTGVNAIPVG